jgi:hypothetical protein
VALALLPLLGVGLLGWEARGVIAYYWAANLAVLITQPFFMLVGGMRILREQSRIRSEDIVRSGEGTLLPIGGRGGLLFGVGFFCVHFSIFTLVHLVFLTSFQIIDTAVLPAAVVLQVLRRIVLERRAELESDTANLFPIHLYGGVVAVHVTILFGGWVALTLGANMPLVAALFLCGIGAAGELAWGAVRSRRVRATEED